MHSTDYCPTPLLCPLKMGLGQHPGGKGTEQSKQHCSLLCSRLQGQHLLPGMLSHPRSAWVCLAGKSCSPDTVSGLWEAGPVRTQPKPQRGWEEEGERAGWRLPAVWMTLITEYFLPWGGK